MKVDVRLSHRPMWMLLFEQVLVMKVENLRESKRKKSILIRKINLFRLPMLNVVHAAKISIMSILIPAVVRS